LIQKSPETPATTVAKNAAEVNTGTALRIETAGMGE
jgi:hypothetical protein